MTDYHQTLSRVLDEIDRNLEQSLTLAQLSEVACLSPFHFHRLFSSMLGMPLNGYIRQLRLKRAAYQLVYRPEHRVTDIAFAAGYQNAESFSRAFRQVFGQSPTTFQANPDWEYWQTLQQPLSNVRKKNMTDKLPETEIVEFPEIQLAVFEHKGDPVTLGASIQRFIAWRKSVGLRPDISRTFNLLYDDPEATPADEYRFDLAAEVKHSMADDAAGIVSKTIPTGRYARVRHIGSDECLAPVVQALYGRWFPESGESLADFPLIFERVRFFPDVAEHEAVTDIYLPLK
ncbi:AraC family transcriptional regulator [Photobacterium sp. CCB-ST2H9]|uniref:AraC family transcriptional regulator n=1 Tax=Photobacterium sp. CCB-ST2H9 TaxID=2912855 RepID=UPI0020061249|nr:AraC family transcriptional regulator [Photobacterium sp. CCB-ST2H9]UTM55999.1 AraC family transcriptional regulator [Photobacterium sp. CCB-ST2H9]